MKSQHAKYNKLICAGGVVERGGRGRLASTGIFRKMWCTSCVHVFRCALFIIRFYNFTLNNDISRYSFGELVIALLN